MTLVQIDEIGTGNELTTWESDTRNGPVTNDTIYVARATASLSLTGAVFFSSTDVDAGRFRVLEGAEDGITIDCSAANTLRCREAFFVLRRLSLDDVGGGQLWWNEATYDGKALLDRVQAFAKAAATIPFLDYADEASFYRDCAALGGTGFGNFGFIATSAPTGEKSYFFNCLSYKMDGSLGIGFHDVEETYGCISIDSKGNDFSSVTKDDYCISSDATAIGTNSQTSKTAAECFRDASSDDFRVKDSDSPQVDAGIWLPPVKPLHPDVALTTPSSMKSLVTGLREFYPLSEGKDSTSTDVVNGYVWSKHASHAWARTLNLTALRDTTENGNVLASEPIYKETGSWTIECVLSSPGGSGKYFYASTNGGLARYQFGVTAGGTAIQRYIVNDQGSVLTSGTFLLNRPINKVPSIIELVDDEGTLTCYQDGIEVGSISYTRFPTTFGNHQFLQNCQGDYSSFGIWERALTEREIRHRAQHPWSLIGGDEPRDLLGVYRPQPTQRVVYDVGPYEFVPPVRAALQPKPEPCVLNRAHPLAQHCTLAIPGTFFDLATGIRGTPNAGLVQTREGLDCANAGTLEFPQAMTFDSAPVFSWAMWLKGSAMTTGLKSPYAPGAGSNGMEVRFSSGTLLVIPWGHTTYTFSATTWEEDVWYHVMLSYRAGSTDLELHRDGRLVETASATGFTPRSGTTAIIGAATTGGTRHFDGVIGDFKYWDVPLVGRQIADLYDNELNGNWPLYQIPDSIFSRVPSLVG